MGAVQSHLLHLAVTLDALDALFDVAIRMSIYYFRNRRRNLWHTTSETCLLEQPLLQDWRWNMPLRTKAYLTMQ